MDRSTILITGPMRSGTTLTCELLGSLPDTVALDEPLGPVLAGDLATPHAKAGWVDRGLARLGRHRASVGRETGTRLDQVAGGIEEFVRETRQSALTRGVVRSKSVDGQVTGRKVSDDVDDKGVRKKLATVGEISVDKPLTPDFTLVIKHPGGFTACLEVLVARFPVYALVRNPLSLLLSWQSVPIRIRSGHVPVAESLSPELAGALARLDDPIDRQLHILGWFFGEFDRFLPRSAVLRYEDIVATGGKSLEVVVPAAASLDRELVDRNRARPSGEDHAMLGELRDRLFGTDGAWWKYYSPDDVAELMASLT